MSVIASFVLPHPPLIVKEVGKGEEVIVEKTIESYKKVAKEIAKLKPETIIISSPHTLYYKDYFYISKGPELTGTFKNFGAPNVSFKEHVDIELVEEISYLSKTKNFPAGTVNQEIELDHGTMVPLYFIRKELTNCQIVVVGLSELSLQKHYELGNIIQKAIDNLGRKVVFVASGDLSHRLQKYGPYGYIEEGPIYEEKIQKTLSNGNFIELLKYNQELLEKAAECGHPSFTIMAGVIHGREVQKTFYSHEDVTGVGYGIWSYYPSDKYVLLAKKAITTYINYNKKISIDSLTDEFKERKAAFVSIHEKGNLRGCIGTYLPVHETIAKEIIENAILAATQDPRFPPIKKDELDFLDISVDVLTKPEKINSISELNPKKYGIIVQNGEKTGLLLPDLDGIDEIEKQLSIAKQKANINQTEEVTIYKFEVVRHR